MSIIPETEYDWVNKYIKCTLQLITKYMTFQPTYQLVQFACPNSTTLGKKKRCYSIVRADGLDYS